MPSLRFSVTARWALIATITAALTACASTGSPQNAAALPQYEQLSVQSDGTREFRDERIAAYRTVQLSRVNFKLKENASLNNEDREKLANAFSARLKAHLLDAGYLVSNNDARAVRISATITDVEEPSPVVNLLSTLLVLAPITRGGIAVEIEARDPNDNQRLAALAYTGKAGMGDAFQSFTALGHAQKEVDRASLRFARLVSGQPRT